MSDDNLAFVLQIACAFAVSRVIYWFIGGVCHTINVRARKRKLEQAFRPPEQEKEDADK